MRFLLLCVGKLREEWQRAACAEYLKRLSRYGAFEVRETPDQPEPVKPFEALYRKVMEAEGASLLAALRPDDWVVALDRLGTAYDSEALAKRACAWEQNGRRIVWIIGGSLGLDQRVLSRANERISLGKLTLPHALARVVALEQMYRTCKINAGERYHK